MKYITKFNILQIQKKPRKKTYKKTPHCVITIIDSIQMFVNNTHLPLISKLYLPTYLFLYLRRKTLVLLTRSYILNLLTIKQRNRIQKL